MNVLVSRVRTITEAFVDQSQALNATVAAQAQEIQDKLTEVLRAAKRELPVAPEIHPQGLAKATSK